MNDAKREELAYRIITGDTIVDIAGTKYLLTVPDARIRRSAQEVYDKALRASRFEGWLTDKQCLALLVRNGSCSPEVDHNIKLIGERIEDLQVQLYDNMFSSDLYDSTKKELAKVRNKRNSMIQTRHSLDHVTAKGFAEAAKRQFLVCSTLRLLDSGEKIEVDAVLVERIINKISRMIITTEQIRELARTEPWLSIWQISKPNPFNYSAVGMSEEQRTLMMYTKMYDNAQQHPECPPDRIIKDDDLFDGWMIKERKKRDKENATKQMERRVGKYGKNGDEVFVPVKRAASEKLTPEQLKERRKEVESLNDMHGRIVKKQRQGTIKKLGQATDSQFPDRKIQIQMEANQQFVDKVKGKK